LEGPLAYLASIDKLKACDTFFVASLSYRAVLGIIFGPAALSVALSVILDTTLRFSSFDEFWNVFVWIIPLMQALFFVAVLVALRRENSSLRQLVNFQRRLVARDVGLGVSLYIVGFGIIIAYVYAWSLFQPSYASPSIGRASALFIILVGSLTAGVFEETIWRGYGISRLEKLMGNSTSAAVVSSFGFSLWHVPHPGGPLYNMPYTFLVGLVYSYAYIRLRRLFPLMLGHWLTDAIGFTMSYLFTSS